MSSSISDNDSNSDNDRERWNEKYRAASRSRTPGSQSPGSRSTNSSPKIDPDPFLHHAFTEYIRPLFPNGGCALDLAGGAGRHAIWMAKQGWDVTLIDISETGVEQARQNAGPFASHIHFVVDDLTHFKAAQIDVASGFEVVMVFCYLERRIFSEIVKVLLPGGLLIYKTYTSEQAKLAGGPKNLEHLLQPRELVQLAGSLRILHYRETVAEKATAELVARKEIPVTTV
ncbi:MAG: class I SAM-dependent methyltransferase [Terriglobales bacterium]